MSAVMFVVAVRSRMTPEEFEMRRAQQSSRRSSPRTLRWGPWGWGAAIAVCAGMLVLDINEGSPTGALVRDVGFAAIFAFRLRSVLRERGRLDAAGEQP